MKRIILLAMISFIISGCGFKDMLFKKEGLPVKSEVIRKADWKVNFNDVYFTDANNGWIIGDKGTIVHTSDGGKNWETQNSGTDVNLNRIQFISDKEAWIVGDNGTVLNTIDGRNWRKQVITKGHLVDLHFVDKYNGWVVGEAGALFYTPDGGKTWKFQFSGLGEALNGVHFINNREGLITAEMGLTLKTTDGGKNWEMQGSTLSIAFWMFSFPKMAI